MSYSSDEARLLDNLGPDADAVADFLRSQEIKGIRHAVRQLNPVCRYMQKVAPDMAQPTIINGDTLLVTLKNGSRVETSLPSGVKQFLVEYNKGKYPDLILPRDAV